MYIKIHMPIYSFESYNPTFIIYSKEITHKRKASPDKNRKNLNVQ